MGQDSKDTRRRREKTGSNALDKRKHPIRKTGGYMVRDTEVSKHLERCGTKHPTRLKTEENVIQDAKVSGHY